MPSYISKINGVEISAARADYVFSSNVEGPLGADSIATASYIDPTFISASAAASGFGSGGGGGTAATASLALTLSQSQAGSGSIGSGLHRVALLDIGTESSPIYYDHNGITYNALTNRLTIGGGITAGSGVTASLQGTASWATNAITASYALTSAGTVTNATSASFASTASYLNPLNQNLTINGNLQVFGTASYSYVSASQLNVGTNTISVNVAEPAERFGGLIVYDSGSLSHQATASLFWDSLNNHWIYQNASGSTYSGGMLISGPRNTGAIGNEVGTTNNALMKGKGGDHITSSGIFDNGTDVYTNRNVQITGSLNATGSLVVTGPFQVTNGIGVYWIDSSNTGTELYVSSSGFSVRDADTNGAMLTAVRSINGEILVSIGDIDAVNNGTNIAIDDDAGTVSINNSNVFDITGRFNTQQITASIGIQGTASYATQALTASYALSSAGVAGGVTSIIAGSGISVDQSTGNVTITNTGGGGSTPTGSLLVTASVSLNTITFTKGDGSTFPITVDTGSGGGGGGLTFQQVQMIAFLGS
jgi:hypothetical protein